MSKFFKALENAEREREAGSPPAGVETAAAPAQPTPQGVVAAEPVTTAPTTAAAQPVVAGGETAAPTAAPARARRDRARDVDVEGGETPPPTAPPARRDRDSAARMPVYGAPIARRAAAHEQVFEGMLPPASVTEPGQIDDHLVSLLEPTSLAAERYRTVRLHIENLRHERDVRLVAVSSPSRGDGKTMSAINLAGALAQAPDARVALVEVDVRHPGMARYLGLSPHRGLSTYLLDADLGVDDVLAQPSGMGFAVVVAGPASSMPYELLKSPRLGALLADLRQRFDFVLLDTPPVLPFPDVGIVRDLVDGFVLIVRANRTPREMVRDSFAAVGADHVLGVVFNDDERSAVATSHDEDEGGWRAVLPRGRGGVRAA